MSKIANLIKSNLTNLAVNQGSNLVSSLFSHTKNSAATNAAAAKILNKSPLELNDNSPVSHMKQNPYDYGTVFYPNDVQNLGTGHYMIFDILETDTAYGQVFNAVKKGGVKGAEYLGKDGVAESIKNSLYKESRNTSIKNNAGVEDRIVQPSSGINAGAIGSRHTRVSDSIILYTPPGLQTSYNVTHEGTEAGMMADLLGMGGAGGFVGNFADVLGRIGEVGQKLGAELGGAALALIPGVGDLKGALTKVTGKAFNNNLEMVFKGVPMREFTYNFEFTPKNRKELDSSRKIINLFKYHMHPEIADVGNDFIVPSQFQITYMYMDKRNNYIPKISRCVLKTLDLEHGDASVFSTFSADEIGAAPIYTKMSLQFAETEIMTKKTIGEGF